MTTRKFGRTLLVAALALSLVLSITGGTIAWFTDEVVSANNVITSGNLDVDVLANGESIQDKATLFNAVTKWEPGAVAWENLTVKNEGTLALKYKMAINAVDGNTVDGKGLSSALQVGIASAPIDASASREAVLASVSQWTDFDTFNAVGTLTEKGAADTYGVVIYWAPKANDNDWNVNNDKTASDGLKYLHINLGVKLLATQATHEEDSFDELYDKDANFKAWAEDTDTDWYNDAASEFVIYTAEELAGLAQLVNSGNTFNGKTVKLGKNINLDNRSWTPIGTVGTSSTDFSNSFRGTFDGQGHIVSNLDVSNEGWAGLFGLAYKAELKNVKLENVAISSNRMAGSLVGQLYGSIDNCHVKKADIHVVPNAVAEGKFDNGDKVGGIVGWIGDNNNNHHLNNCSATDVTISAYRDVGGIAGYVAWSTVVQNNKAFNVDIIVDQFTNHYGEKDANAGYIWGRNSVSSTGVGVVDLNNTSDTECSINSTYIKGGCVLSATGDEVLMLSVVTDYPSNELVIPEGVTAIANYAFTTNANVKTVTLASTVRDLGRVFDSSAVEKVILNEGLETISSRAFRDTKALKEVVIPSTVNTIADDAFQKTWLKEITIPATVKYVGAQAFGASKIETVTFEGNTEIQNKAFRGCADLRTVYMNGNDIVFTNTTGQTNCWFCNSESNNPNVSNITFYVKNDTVASKVKTAMGHEANNTPVYVNGVLFSN